MCPWVCVYVCMGVCVCICFPVHMCVHGHKWPHVPSLLVTLLGGFSGIGHLWSYTHDDILGNPFSNDLHGTGQDTEKILRGKCFFLGSLWHRGDGLETSACLLKTAGHPEARLSRTE